MSNNYETQINSTIEEVVEKCRKENGIVNKVIRDDVFNILEKHCYVVYYPLTDEDINGFHIMRTVKNERKHFVYINTWNTTERQIFTAAHELGHIWNVYLKVKNIFPAIDEYVASLGEKSSEEFVVNKFAAQLLMPADLFKIAMNNELEKLEYNGRSISKINLLRLTASLMNTFFVGYKATTKRFFEIGKINESTYNAIKAYEENSDFNETFENILKEGDYKRLNRRTQSKNISNLTDVIRDAENKGCVLVNTIDTLKKDFGIIPPKFSEQDNEVVF